uniref:Uncharacterized protein n=1 Tax=Colobus angolensis palliatus TaxID=336983 RepID=A0A2K5KD76_COLAP
IKAVFEPQICGKSTFFPMCLPFKFDHVQHMFIPMFCFLLLIPCDEESWNGLALVHDVSVFHLGDILCGRNHLNHLQVSQVFLTHSLLKLAVL